MPQIEEAGEYAKLSWRPVMGWDVTEDKRYWMGTKKSLKNMLALLDNKISPWKQK